MKAKKMIVSMLAVGLLLSAPAALFAEQAGIPKPQVNVSIDKIDKSVRAAAEKAMEQHGGKVGGYFLFPGLAKADAKMKQLAEQTEKNLPQANELPFQDVFYYKDGPINIWEFRNMAVDGSARQGGKKAQKAVQSVTIGAESSKVIEIVISPKDNNGKDKAVSKADALKIVTPVAKQVFGVDLKSYELKIDQEWGDCIFTSKGKPSLVAKFDNKGNLSRIHLAVDSNNRK